MEKFPNEILSILLSMSLLAYRRFSFLKNYLFYSHL